MAEFVHYSVENNVGKGEIAHDEQILLFPHYFQKDSFSGSLKPWII